MMVTATMEPEVESFVTHFSADERSAQGTDDSKVQKRTRPRGMESRTAKEGKVTKTGNIDAETRKIAKATTDYEQQKRISFSTKERTEFGQRIKLDVLYPAQYVAFIDDFDRDTGNLRERRVVSHSRDLRKVQKAISELPEADRHKVCLDYVEPLGRER